MNASDIAALMKGVAPVVRDLIVEISQPLVEKIGALEAELAALRSIDHGDVIRAAVVEAVAALPPPVDGKDGAPGRDGADGAPGKDGIDGKDGAPGVDGKDGAPGERGADGTPGRDGVDGQAGSDGRDGADGINGKDGEPGKEGPPGKLAIVKTWAAGVTYEAEVRSHNGGTYQAIRDTGSEPGGEDWVCIAAPGTNGKNADEIEVRETYDPDASYRRLSIVALNGNAFISRKNDPGPCPGEDWQVIAMRGKPGPVTKGEPGKSVKGDPGPPVAAMSVDAMGMLTLVNGDGSEVLCDLYPLLAKLN